jgi:hypothetical protein
MKRMAIDKEKEWCTLQNLEWREIGDWFSEKTLLNCIGVEFD